MASFGPRLLARRECSPDGCWLWTGGRNPVSGYGQINGVGGDKGTYYVHRVAYEAWVGPIPSGFHIDHLCQVRACFNPAHLEAVTPRENTARTDAWANAAKALRKSHCKRGHSLDDPLNVHVLESGRRYCRACRRITSLAYYHRRKAVV